MFLDRHTALYNISESSNEDIQIIIRLTRICNYNCGFCWVELSKEIFSYEEIIELINNTIEVFKWKKINFTLSWWEPTLHPRFRDIVYYIWEKWYNMDLQTNAILFADKFFLKKNKLTNIRFFVSLHAHNGLLNKIITWGNIDVFDKHIEGIKNIINEYWINSICFNFVANIFNIKFLWDYFDFLNDNFAPHWYIQLSISILNQSDKVYPYLIRHTRLVDEINNNLYRVWKIKLNLVMYWSGCMMPFYILRKLKIIDIKDLYNKELDFSTVFKNINSIVKSEKCESCMFNKMCFWVSNKYEKKFSLGELKPIWQDDINKK